MCSTKPVPFLHFKFQVSLNQNHLFFFVSWFFDFHIQFWLFHEFLACLSLFFGMCVLWLATYTFVSHPTKIFWYLATFTYILNYLFLEFIHSLWVLSLMAYDKCSYSLCKLCTSKNGIFPISQTVFQDPIFLVKSTYISSRPTHTSPSMAVFLSSPHYRIILEVLRTSASYANDDHILWRGLPWCPILVKHQQAICVCFLNIFNFLSEEEPELAQRDWPKFTWNGERHRYVENWIQVYQTSYMKPSHDHL